MGTKNLGDIMREQLDYLLENHNGQCTLENCKECARLIHVGALLCEPFATKFWESKHE